MATHARPEPRRRAVQAVRVPPPRERRDLRAQRHSSKKPSDIVDEYDPTGVFVYFKGVNAAEAFDRTMKRFEAAGWKMSSVRTHGQGEDTEFHATFEKDGMKIAVIINKNDWGIQGLYALEPPPAKR